MADLLDLPAVLKLRAPKVRSIVTDGHPTLSKVACEVLPSEVSSDEIQQLLADMIETMKCAPGIGLAAPQIDVSKRIMVFYLPRARDPDGKGVKLTCLINPKVTALDEEKESDFEGCLSVPGMRGKVARLKSIRYSGLNESGELIDREANGWHARVVQHEFDHLNGILYPEIMTEGDPLLTLDEMQQQQQQQG
jgi:peptide deformylase